MSKNRLQRKSVFVLFENFSNVIYKHVFLFLVALLPLVFLSSCNESVAEPDAVPTEDSFIPLLAASFEGQTINDELLIDYSKRYRAVECAVLSSSERTRLRELNPEIVLIKYQASVSASLDLINKHPDWAVRDSEGNPVALLNSGSLYMLDPGNRELREAITTNISKVINEEGYDGIMYDEAAIVRSSFYSGFSGINPRTGEIYNIEDFRAEQLATITTIRASFPNIIIACNSVGNGEKYFDNLESARAFAEQCDYLVAESYRGGLEKPLNWFMPESEWIKNLEMSYDLANYGSALMANVEIEKELANDQTLKEEFDLFHYATFLLGYREDAVFANSIQDNSVMVGGGYINTPVFSEFQKINPGEPLTAEYEQMNDAYAREFTNILALVNPKSTELKVTLDKSYVDLNGVNFSSGYILTLPAHRATILTKR